MRRRRHESTVFAIRLSNYPEAQEVVIDTRGGKRTVPIAWWRDMGGTVTATDVEPRRAELVPCEPGELRSFVLIGTRCDGVYVHLGPGRRLTMCDGGALHGLGLRLKPGEVRWYRLDWRLS